jgi:hypothetical protein
MEIGKEGRKEGRKERKGEGKGKGQQYVRVFFQQQKTRNEKQGKKKGGVCTHQTPHSGISSFFLQIYGTEK